ncbi:hypothetical protein NL676_029635 [Syzygium grande]|nr:hypothetical protein NL676_029635 [Syzygium grande]
MMGLSSHGLCSTAISYRKRSLCVRITSPPQMITFCFQVPPPRTDRKAERLPLQSAEEAATTLSVNPAAGRPPSPPNLGKIYRQQLPPFRRPTHQRKRHSLAPLLAASKIVPTADGPETANRPLVSAVLRRNPP